MKKKRLLIIPAKSKSSRIKNKNFKIFHGKMMIEYPLISAKKSKIFHKIHVSTESKNIKNKLENKGFQIDFLRSRKLTTKNTSLFSVYKFVLDEYKKRKIFFDEVWSILPCSPLITYRDLINLKNLIERKKIKKPIISVCKYNAPIEWAFIKSKKNLLIPLNKNKQLMPSQKFSHKYYDVGSLSVFDVSNFNVKKNFYDKKFYGFELPLEKSVDIDYKDDWEFAKKLFLKN